MKQVYGYIRVSTTEQITGASLPEQKSAIKEYAKKNNLNIIHFYEESKTAAKKGRPLFLEMIKNLKAGNADGVIMHKIDRSARNLHDWASVGDLIDNGIDVFFAHESLNMNERGGRLSADIQAVMASDYVRNLRQETIKGMYGRVKQGLYPWAAPIGYNNNGKGQLKTIDNVQSEFVKKTFELYLNDDYNVRSLSTKMEELGLRNKRGNRVCKNGITKILKNPFYTGLIKVKGKTYDGKHESIIDPRIFKQVQLKIKGRQTSKGIIHFYLFRKMIRCDLCNYIMSGEKQKGHVYYRCASKGCPTKSIREDHVELFVQNTLKVISLSQQETETIRLIRSESNVNQVEIRENLLRKYRLQLGNTENKLTRLLDLLLEEKINQELYDSKKEDLLITKKEICHSIDLILASKVKIESNIEAFLELSKNPEKIYENANNDEKREILDIVTSNLTASGKRLSFSMVSPYKELANRDILYKCALTRDTQRKLYSKIVYSDINTSPVIPKPMNKKQLRHFYQFLKDCSETLSKIGKLQDYYNDFDT
jgi:DNA invertase Pin-like site-specific DNA recombinase